MKSSNYSIKVYQVDTNKGKEWIAEFSDIKGCIGGGKTDIEAILDALDNRKEYNND